MKYKDQLWIEDTFKGAEMSVAWSFAAAALISTWAKPSFILIAIAVAVGVFYSCLQVFIWRKGKPIRGFESLLCGPLFLALVFLTKSYRSETRGWTSALQLIFCMLIWQGVVSLILSYSREAVLKSLGFRDKRCPESE